MGSQNESHLSSEHILLSDKTIFLYFNQKSAQNGRFSVLGNTFQRQKHGCKDYGVPKVQPLIILQRYTPILVNLLMCVYYATPIPRWCPWGIAPYNREAEEGRTVSIPWSPGWRVAYHLNVSKHFDSKK